MSAEKKEVSEKRLRALKRFFNAWYKYQKRKPECETVPSLERWLAGVLGYANHSPVNNALFCKANFDISKVQTLHKKLKQRLRPGDKMVRMDIFLVENNPWAQEQYLPKLKRQRMRAGTLSGYRRKRNGEARFVRIKKQHDTIVLEFAGRLDLRSARLSIVDVARGGRQLVIRPAYSRKK